MLFFSSASAISASLLAYCGRVLEFSACLLGILWFHTLRRRGNAIAFGEAADLDSDFVPSKAILKEP